MNDSSNAFEIDFSTLRTVIVASELQQIQLSLAPLHRGDAAGVFGLDGWAHLVGKIYRRPTTNLGERIEAMLTHPLGDRSTVAWPADQLLAVGSYQTFIGFAMPRIEMGVPLPEFWQTGARMPRLGEIQYVHRLRVARSLASAVARVHACGQVVGSLRPDNVLVNPSLKATLAACDTWQFRTPKRYFPCRRVHAAYSTPELQNDESTPRNQGHDCFALGVILFQLLNQGAHPLMSKLAGSTAMPSKMRDLFQRCFETGIRDPQQSPTAKTWETVMANAEASLRTCSANPQHRFGRELDHCPICGAAALPATDVEPEETFQTFGIVIPDDSGGDTAPTDPERSPTQPTQPERPPTQPTQRQQPVISPDSPAVSLSKVDFTEQGKKPPANSTTIRPQAPETRAPSGSETRNRGGDDEDVTLTKVDLPEKGKKTMVPPRGKPTMVTPRAGETKVAKRAVETMLPQRPKSETSLPRKGNETRLPPSGKDTMIPDQNRQPGDTDYGIEVDESQTDNIDTRPDHVRASSKIRDEEIRLTQFPNETPKRQTETKPQTGPTEQQSQRPSVSRTVTAPQPDSPQSTQPQTGPTEQQSPPESRTVTAPQPNSPHVQDTRTKTATDVPSGPKSVLGETKTAEVVDQLAPTKTAEVIDTGGTQTADTANETNQGNEPIEQTVTDQGAGSPFLTSVHDPDGIGETETAQSFDAEKEEKTKRPVWAKAAGAVLVLGICAMVAYVLWPSPNPPHQDEPSGPWMAKVERHFFLPESVQQRVANDLKAAAEKDRPHYRYFSLSAFHNNENIPKEELKRHRTALKRLIRHFSPLGNEMKVGVVSNSAEMIYRVDLREWGDKGRHVWDAILEHYPYALHHGYSDRKSKETLQKNAEYIGQATMCDVSIVRGDWFLARAWNTELYGQITTLTQSNNKKGDLANALEKAAKRYDEDVTFTQAAAELGFYKDKTEQFRKTIEDNEKLKNLGLEALLEEDGTMRREEWGSLMDGPSLFQITAREFGFGPPYSVIR